MSSSDVRLDQNVIPSAYRLTLDANVDTCAFHGSVGIRIEIAAPTETITLHAADLEITAASVTSEGATTPLEIHTRSADQLIDCIAPHSLAGGATLLIEFAGQLNEQLIGFYRSTFEHDGATSYLGVTQFEPAFARYAFPCFDEPAFKATFEISLVIDQDHTAISNSAQIGEHPVAPGRKRVDFEPTMKMSTYLVAWVIGDLVISEPVTANDTEVRVVHVPGRSNTQFALEVAQHSLEYFEDYYGIAYPGGKLDLIAVPDFANGAMENTGCVTFRETLLLVDPDLTSRAEQERAAEVIAHEIAHMWFGNLVTMKWWNGIWLNEAFATFMELKCIEAYRPDWKVWESFATAKTEALSIDSLASTRPIEFPVASPDDAEAMFDVLTYEKGCALLRMFEQWLGPEQFRAGVRRYLGAHAYGNTEAEDLWAALGSDSTNDVTQMMSTWIYHGGYPSLNVDTTATGISVNQQPFRFDRTDNSSSPANPVHLWAVPMQVTARLNDEATTTACTLETQSVSVDLGGVPSWVTVNPMAHGFFRVNYSDTLAEGLAKRFSQMPAVERYFVLDDQWSDLIAGSTTVDRLTHTIASLSRTDRDIVLWRRIATTFFAARQARIASSWTPIAQLIRDEHLEAASACFEAGTDTEWVGIIWRIASLWCGDDTITVRARSLFESDSAPADLEASILEIIAGQNNRTDFDEMFRRSAATNSPQAEQRYLQALTRFTEPTLVDRLIDLCESTIRTQNAPLLLGLSMAQPDNNDHMWNTVQTRWDEFTALYPANTHIRMMQTVRTFAERGLCDQVSAFFSQHTIPHAAQEVEQNLEMMGHHLRMAERLSS